MLFSLVPMQLRIGQTRFQEFAKPYFDKGKALFYSIRTSYLFWSIKENMVWRIVKYANENMPRFWVLVKIDGEWKIKHYVLSMTVPNEKCECRYQNQRAHRR
jgi:hypothetical protein